MKKKSSKTPKFPNMTSNDSFQIVPSSSSSWFYCTHNSPRCIECVQNFIRHNILPSFVERPLVAQYLKRQVINYTLYGNYEEASKFHEYSHQFSKACLDSMREFTQSAQISKINTEMTELNRRIDTMRNQFRSDMENLKIKSLEEYEKLIERQKNEIEEFNIMWSSEEKLRKYSKPSIELQVLRDKEKSMILQKQYNQAVYFRKEAEKLEEIETKRAQNFAQRDCEIQKQSLFKRHINEKQSCSVHHENEEIALKEKLKKDIEKIYARISKLEYDKERGFFPEHNESPLDEDTRASHAPMALSTPRTREKYLEFRQSVPFKKLVLKPIRKPAKLSRNEKYIKSAILT